MQKGIQKKNPPRKGVRIFVDYFFFSFLFDFGLGPPYPRVYLYLLPPGGGRRDEIFLSTATRIYVSAVCTHITQLMSCMSCTSKWCFMYIHVYGYGCVCMCEFNKTTKHTHTSTRREVKTHASSPHEMTHTHTRSKRNPSRMYNL